MLLSHKHKFIFIHIFKTAGTSVSSQLAYHSRVIDFLAYGSWPTVKLVNIFNVVMKRKGMELLTGFKKHATALDIKNALPDSLFHSYFKFAFVRNPWDLCVSLYFYLRQNPKLHDSKLANNLNFIDFIKVYIEKKPQKQIDFIADENGHIIIDYIGKYERLQNDFNEIMNQIGLNAEPLPQKNISKSRPNHDYRGYYNDDTTELVGHYFHSDIEKFNYSFE